ncbi:thioredoxin family protein [Aporhodopirellula aestuarii]
MGPLVDELTEELGDGVRIVKVNVDEASQTATKYGIPSIPTFAVV